MPDPPFNLGNQLPPNVNTSNVDWSLDYFAKKERNKMFGYNMNPDAGYEFKAIHDDGSKGKPSTFSWYSGLAIENTSIDDAADGELLHNTSLNRYVPEDGFQNTVINTEALSNPTDTTQQKPYLDSNFKLNMGDSAAISAANMLGSAFNGQGIGIDNDPAAGLTPVSSYDLRSSLAGRILGGTGAMEDTPIGLIGAQQLGRALQNNILFNAQKETIGRLNLNPIDLIKGQDNVFSPNYEITVPKGALGKVFDFASRVTGFELPISILNKQASIYSSDKTILGGNWFPEATDELVKFTSAGQRRALKTNLEENEYYPTYDKLDMNAGEGYDTLNDLRKHKHGDIWEEDGVGYLKDANGKEDQSVLDDNGMVIVSPLKRGGVDSDPKKYMLSLENLAWCDHTALLPDYEIGRGDLLTDKKGRMMWFPPYDVKISEQVSVRWNEENFIGRGEPLFTYNNTNRTVQLSFKIIVDHSSNLNGLRSKRTNLSKIEQAQFDIKDVAKPAAPENTFIPNNLLNDGIKYYFPNANSEVISPATYEGEKGSAGEGTTSVDSSLGITTKFYPDSEDFGLNETWNDDIQGLIVKLNDKEGEYYNNIIKINSFTSAPGSDTLNEKLRKNRANNIKLFFEKNLEDTDKRVITTNSANYSFVADKSAAVDSEGAKKDRAVTVKIVADPVRDQKIKDESKKKNTDIPDEEQERLKKEIADSKVSLTDELIGDVISHRNIDESKYFEYMRKEDSLMYNSLQDKIKYFHPAFHSMTPEGLNGRLNFLHQCTRQGTSIGDTSDPKNLVFGRPPVCILRLGDFYHTKVVINSLNIGYDTGQWDMNREGIGLQPMVANIDLNLQILGGSSLQGPINRLQNALSFNFYANTEVYDNRADTLVKKDNKYKILNGVLSQYDYDAGTEKGAKLSDEQSGKMKNFFKVEDLRLDPTNTGDTRYGFVVTGSEFIEDIYFVTYKLESDINERSFFIKHKAKLTTYNPLSKDYKNDLKVIMGNAHANNRGIWSEEKVKAQAKAAVDQIIKDSALKYDELGKDNTQPTTEDEISLSGGGSGILG